MDEAAQSRFPAGRGGIFASLLRFSNEVATFFETRAALFAAESKRALLQLVLLVASLIAAVLSFTLGYIFLIALIVGAIARALQIPWEWSAFGAAVVHFGLAAIFLLIMATRMKKNPFPGTAAELRKDREWLRNLDTTSRPKD